VTRLHFIECAGNRSSRRAKNVQETHGMTSCAEWTGVLLSTLLKECGLKGSATWFVAEGSEEVKGASSMPIAKAMEDCFVAYGMNGEAVRPQNGFPLRLMVPGFEGIFHTKWLRRIKVVDRYYMNYNDYGHLDRDAKVAALDYQIGPKSGDHVPVRRTTAARPRLLRDQRPRLVRRRRHQAGGSVHRRRQTLEQSRVQGDATAHGPCPFRLSVELGRTRDRAPVAVHGRTRSGATVAGTDRQVLEQALRPDLQRAGLDNSIQPWRIAGDGSVTNGFA
jgi:sulfane dehydrogenase subunit SoxC